MKEKQAILLLKDWDFKWGYQFMSKWIKKRFAHFIWNYLYNKNVITNFSYVRDERTMEVVWTQYHSSLQLNWARPNKLHRASMIYEVTSVIWSLFLLTDQDTLFWGDVEGFPQFVDILNTYKEINGTIGYIGVCHLYTPTFSFPTYGFSFGFAFLSDAK